MPNDSASSSPVTNSSGVALTASSRSLLDPGAPVVGLIAARTPAIVVTIQPILRPLIRFGRLCTSQGP